LSLQLFLLLDFQPEPAPDTGQFVTVPEKQISLLRCGMEIFLVDAESGIARVER
jgi:hypothetical protein